MLFRSPEIPENGIHLRGDGFYGPQEFTRWLQIYSLALCHYAVIFTKPKDNSGRLWNSVLFRDFTRDDWLPEETLPPLTDNNWTIIEHSGGYIWRELLDLLRIALDRAILECLTGHEESQSYVYSLARALRNLGKNAHVDWRKQRILLARLSIP